MPSTVETGDADEIAPAGIDPEFSSVIINDKPLYIAQIPFYAG
jgi:hypothetical protein